jgi:dihydrofolate reductase
MRKLIYGINVTLDGCCDHRKMGGSVEMLEYFGSHLLEADTLLYGRITYQLMVPYWPDIANNPTDETQAEIDFAKAFNKNKLVVVSRTLQKAEGKNTQIIRENCKEEILKLKQQPGKDILTGGVDLPSQIFDLIDEFRIVVHPAIVGEGRRLWNDTSLPEKLKLELVDTKVFPSGSIALRYVKNSESK